MTGQSKPLGVFQLPSFHHGCPGARTAREFLRGDHRRTLKAKKHHRDRKLKQPTTSLEFLTKYEREAVLYQTVTRVNRPNHRGARVPVHSGLNVRAWEFILQGYHQDDLIDFVKFGFPLGFLGDRPPTGERKNHPSATRHGLAIRKYIDKELSCKALIGPFDDLPFREWVHTSPAMTRPKKASDERRVIFDLSHGGLESVNGGIPENWYAGKERRVVLPTADDLADLIVRQGRGSHLFSIDIARAYRIFRIDPRDWPLTGIWYDGQVLLDRAIQFGSRTGALACSMATEAITYFFFRATGNETFVYIDDFVCAKYGYDEACECYRQFIYLLYSLGIDLSYQKCVAPTTCLVWIGVEYDTVRMRMRIDPVKVEEVRAIIVNWLEEDLPRSTQEVESLLGSLFHLVKCGKKARPFLNRLQDFLALTKLGKPLRLTPGAREDLRWLAHFSSRFNGIQLLSPSKPQACLIVDACPSGIGGMCGNRAYFLELPQWFRDMQLSINCLECVNILFAMRYFQEELTGACLIIATDNTAAASTVANFKAKNPILRSIAREVVMLAAAWDIVFHVIHVHGEHLTATADALSRQHLGHPFSCHVKALKDDGFSVEKLPDAFWMPPLGL